MQVVKTIATHVLILIVISINVTNIIVNGRTPHVMIMTKHAPTIKVQMIVHPIYLVIGTKVINVKTSLHVKITHIQNVLKMINMDVRN
jgi:hypothetical protein